MSQRPQEPDPSEILEKLRPFSPLIYHQYTIILDHFNTVIQQRKLMELFKTFEIHAESKKLLELHAMLRSKHLAMWIEHLDALRVKDESGRVLKEKVIGKLRELHGELPADELEVLENKELIETVEKQFENDHGIRIMAFSASNAQAPNAHAPNALPPNALAPNALPPNAHAPNAPAPIASAPNAHAPNAHAPNAPAPIASAPNAHAPNAHAPNAPAPNAPEFFENVQIPAIYETRNETELRALMIIGKIDRETDMEVEYWTEQGVQEDDERILEQLDRKYRNKLMEIKYFSVLP